jgi:hypothetical protein
MIYPYAYIVILFRRVMLDLLSTLYLPLLCCKEKIRKMRSSKVVYAPSLACGMRSPDISVLVCMEL